MSMNAVPSGPPLGNGEPPSNLELDRRSTVLEARFDTILPTLATKQVLQELRSEMLQMFADQKAYFQIEMQKLRAGLFKAFNDAMRWIMALMVTLFIGTFAINFAMWNTMKSAIDDLRPTSSASQGNRVPAPEVPLIFSPGANRDSHRSI